VNARTEELRQANEHLSRLSFSDALTGLANRRKLDETLDAEWRRAQRLNTSIALILLDVDFFKHYNDSLGHQQGDQCLAAIAAAIGECVNRAGDLAARYGGEEFMVVLPSAEISAAQALAEKIRVACESRALPHPASSVASVVTVSMGVAAIVPSSADELGLLVERADAALYRAKEAGRNRVAA
jgi:diguanylate cyclase (GGDEF)-like protein